MVLDTFVPRRGLTAPRRCAARRERDKKKATLRPYQDAGHTGGEGRKGLIEL